MGPRRMLLVERVWGDLKMREASELVDLGFRV